MEESKIMIAYPNSLDTDKEIAVLRIISNFKKVYGEFKMLTNEDACIFLGVFGRPDIQEFANQVYELIQLEKNYENHEGYITHKSPMISISSMSLSSDWDALSVVDFWIQNSDVNYDFATKLFKQYSLLCSFSDTESTTSQWVHDDNITNGSEACIWLIGSKDGSLRIEIVKNNGIRDKIKIARSKDLIDGIMSYRSEL